MVEIVGIAAFLAVFAVLVTSAYALTWSAICMIAGAGVAFVAAWVIIEARVEKRQREQHQRLIELIRAARMMGAHVDVPTIEIPKERVPRIGRR